MSIDDLLNVIGTSTGLKLGGVDLNAPSLTPVTLTDRKGGETQVTEDEHPRPDASLEKMARLRPLDPLQRAQWMILWASGWGEKRSCLNSSL